jgi:hypothetical protein
MENILDHVYILYFGFGMQLFFSLIGENLSKFKNNKNDFGGFQLLEAREKKEE